MNYLEPFLDDSADYYTILDVIKPLQDFIYPDKVYPPGEGRSLNGEAIRVLEKQLKKEGRL